MEPTFCDEELQLSRLTRGDEQALAWLRRRLYNIMLRDAYALVPQAQDAEDVVEEALVRVWRFRERLPLDWPGAKRYIGKMVRNVAIDHLRSMESRVAKLELPEDLEAPVATSDAAELLETATLEAAAVLEKRIGNRHLRILRPVAERLSQPYGDVREVYADVAGTLGASSAYVRNVWSEIGKELKATLPGHPSDNDVRELLRLIGSR